MPFQFPPLNEVFDPLRAFEWNDHGTRCATLRAMLKKLPDVSYCRDVERFTFALCEGDRDGYVMKMKRILWALQINGEHLVKTYTPEQLVVLEDDQLASGTEAEKWKVSHMQKVISYQQLINSKLTFPDELLGDYVKDAMKCRKCGSKDFSVVMRQTRSADEPMTAHITCDKCNYHWKIN